MNNEIETERLRLNIYYEKDKEELMDLFTDEEVMKHVGNGVLSRDAAEALWRKLHREFYANDQKTIWAVFSKDDGRYIGHASIRPRPEIKKDWEIGYILKQDEWGKGYATEISRELIKFGFEKLKLPVIFATVDSDNFGSIRVLKKSGMKFLRLESDEIGEFSVYGIRASEFADL